MHDIIRWNFKALQAFVLVAEHKSFKRAAEESLRSQPSISSQVRDLEAQLGFALFERTTRSVALTAEGAELLVYAKKGFGEFANGLEQATRASQDRRELVRVGCIPPVIVKAVPVALPDFISRRPQVDIRIVEHVVGSLNQAVIDHEIDFGVGVPFPVPECDSETIFEHDLCAIFAAGKLPAEKTNISLCDLLDFPLLLAERITPQAQAILDRASRRYNKPVKISHYISQPMTTVSMAAAGEGVGFVSRTVLEALETANVQVLTIGDPPLTRNIAIISRRDRRHSEAVRDLMEAFRNAMQS